MLHSNIYNEIEDEGWDPINWFHFATFFERSGCKIEKLISLTNVLFYQHKTKNKYKKIDCISYYEVNCICVLPVSILFLSTIFLLDCRVDFDSVVMSVVHFILPFVYIN